MLWGHMSILLCTMDMGVSKNRGTPQNIPKWSFLVGKPHGFVGDTHHFRSCPHIHMFPKIGVPQHGWFMMENPIKMDDLGIPTIFRKHPYLENLFPHLLDRCSAIGRRRISSWHRSLPAQFLQSASWDDFIWFWGKKGFPPVVSVIF